MQFTEKTRRLIRERAKDRCELCGTPAYETAQIHHRKPRGMGGTKNPESRSPANGLLVHFRCHHRIEMNRADALTNGWLVRQSDDSTAVPVRLHYGMVLLKDDGSFDVLDEKYQSRSLGEDDLKDSTYQSAEHNAG